MKTFLLVLFFTVAGASVVAQRNEFAKADSIAELFPRHSLTDLKLLSGKLTKSLMTDEGKFRAIYKWVCINIENDYVLAEEILSKRSTLKGAELEKWIRQCSLNSMRTLLRQYRTVCTGYAYLVRELSRHAGIPCEIVDGYGRGIRSNIGGEGFVNHSWNAVLLNGKWYLCDPTWSAGAVSTATRTFIPKFEEGYFMADPTLFVRNHYPLNKTWTLLPDPPSLETFLSAPLIYVNAFKYRVHPASPGTFKITTTKGEKVSFNLVKDSFNETSKVKFLVGSAVANNNVARADSGYRVDHAFSWRGVYAVHFTINDQYVASYEVTVR